MLNSKNEVGFHKVVVTGIGVASPLGNSVNDFWKGLLEGKSGVSAIADRGFSECRIRIFAKVIDYDENKYFSRKELQRLSRASQLAIVAATEAVQDANLELKQHNNEDVGAIVGSSIGGFSAAEPFFQSFFEDSIISPLAIPVVMNNAPASNVSIRFGLKGPLMNVDAACASSNHAIGYAFNLIRFGLSRIVLTGGSDSSFSPSMITSWTSLRALSERNDTPSKACRPFSLDRDGFVLGEGAGILILESESSAIQRKAKIYAEVTGYAAASDAYHLTRPSPQGPSKAMQLALSSANLTPKDIDYINAHATATALNDKVETEAIKNVFGSYARKIPVVGIKPAIGHSIGASGALELISCILSIRDKVLPPTINFEVPDPDCDLDYVTEGKRNCSVNHVMSNSFGFGGSNAVLVISRYQPRFRVRV